MLNIDRANLIANTRANEAKSVNVNQPSKPVTAITTEQDTVTLSQQAMALINGEQSNIKEPTPTYIKPEAASSLLAKTEAITEINSRASIENKSTTTVENIGAASSTTNTAVNNESARAIRFDEIMQSILANRTGIDKDKLAEIDMMIEDIGKNTKLSPEQKEQQIEALTQMKEEVINAGAELQKVTKQTGYSETNSDDKAV